jgi:alpha-beta hydrolase superfamily lysophospholipase
MTGVAIHRHDIRTRATAPRYPVLRPLAAIVTLFLAALAPAPSSAQGAFYTAAPREIAGRAGTLIRYEPMPGAPLGAAAYRVLYRSTGLSGRPIAVSGIVVIPPGPAPAGGRPIVAWAHPTTGIVPHCAPSLAHVAFAQIQGLHEMIARGYVVAATDYPGLGTPGPHPYLVGVSEGRAVIDSVRAARQMPGASAGTRYAVWGHSQGGQAALYTGLLTRSYARELSLVGVAAAAPATDLRTLMIDDANTSGGRNLTAMALWSWARVYNAPMERVVAPQAMPAVNRMAQECIEGPLDIILRDISGRILRDQFLTVQNLPDIEPWRSLLRRNSPAPLPRSVPLFLAQGVSDDLVRPPVTRAYMAATCRNGGRVHMLSIPGGHGFAGRDSAVAAVAWMAGRFAGAPAPSDC